MNKNRVTVSHTDLQLDFFPLWKVCECVSAHEDLPFSCKVLSHCMDVPVYPAISLPIHLDLYC